MVSRASFLCRLSKCVFRRWNLLLSGNQFLKCCRSCFAAILFKTEGFEESVWINCGLMLWILIFEVMSGFQARISGFMREYRILQTWLREKSCDKVLITESCVICDISDCFRKLIAWKSENRLITTWKTFCKLNQHFRGNQFKIQPGTLSDMQNPWRALRATKFRLFVQKNKTFHLGRASKKMRFWNCLYCSLSSCINVFPFNVATNSFKIEDVEKLRSCFYAPQTDFQLYVTCCRTKTCGNHKNYMIKRFSARRVALMCGERNRSGCRI